MFPSQMARFKSVKSSSGPLCASFPRKWYTLKFSKPQVVQFLHVSNRKWYALKLSNLKWCTLCMFPSQMVRLKIIECSSGPLCACFRRKWSALKLSNPQAVHFVHASLTNGTP